MFRMRHAMLGALLLSAPSLRARADPTVRAPHGDRVMIRQSMQSVLPAIRRCFDQALQVDPTISGRLSVRFTIGTSGAVSSVETLPAAASPAWEALRACVAVHVMQITLAPRASPMTVNYPLNFTP